LDALRKELVVVIGNTGAGKSTFVNHIAGCTMVKRKPSDIGLSGIEKVVVVLPTTEGGARDGIMPIGHAMASATFLPHIAHLDELGLAFCDCPGFFDSRGSVINIANTANVLRALVMADGVKIMVLINYQTLIADRGRGLVEMITILSNLFGGKPEEFSDSILVGLNQVTDDDATLDEIKAWLNKASPAKILPIMKKLLQNLVMLDPLEQNSEASTRDQIVQKLQSIPAITNASEVFKTVLTDSDFTKLLEISEHIREKVMNALKGGDFKIASDCLCDLESLKVIQHRAVERITAQIASNIGSHFHKLVQSYISKVNFEDFDEAEVLLKELKEGCLHFGEDLEKEVVMLNERVAYLKEMKDRYQTRKDKEAENEARIKKYEHDNERLFQLLEEQKQLTMTQIKEQTEKYEKMLKESEERNNAAKYNYDALKEAMNDEMEDRISRRLKEMREDEANVSQDKLDREKSRLEAEYAAELQKAKEEKDELLSQQEKERIERDLEMRRMKEEAEAKLQSIEAMRLERIKEQERLQDEVWCQCYTC
jgi:DNA repair exonuclease SbcCD ATPase subunit